MIMNLLSVNYFIALNLLIFKLCNKEQQRLATDKINIPCNQVGRHICIINIASVVSRMDFEDLKLAKNKFSVY